MTGCSNGVLKNGSTIYDIVFVHDTELFEELGKVFPYLSLVPLILTSPVKAIESYIEKNERFVPLLRLQTCRGLNPRLRSLQSVF